MVSVIGNTTDRGLLLLSAQLAHAADYLAHPEPLVPSGLPLQHTRIQSSKSHRRRPEPSATQAQDCERPEHVRFGGHNRTFLECKTVD